MVLKHKTLNRTVLYHRATQQSYSNYRIDAREKVKSGLNSILIINQRKGKFGVYKF